MLDRHFGRPSFTKLSHGSRLVTSNKQFLSFAESGIFSAINLDLFLLFFA
jgi:hypothetical protein